MDAQHHHHNRFNEENTNRPSQIFHAKSDKYNFIYERIKNEATEPSEDPLDLGNSSVHSKSTEVEKYSFCNDIEHEVSRVNAEYYVLDNPNIAEWKPLIDVQQCESFTNNPPPSWLGFRPTSASASDTSFPAILSDLPPEPIPDGVSSNMDRPYSTGAVPSNIKINIDENEILNQHVINVNASLLRTEEAETSCTAGTSVDLETVKETEPKGIRLALTNKDKESGRRFYDKVYSCLYCHAKVKKLPVHLKSAHRDKDRVRALLSLPLNSKERKDGFVLLGKEGNYQHNCRVLESNEGVLILTRRPGKMEAKCLNSSDYEPCPHCFGFVMKKNMWRHKQSCSSNAKNSSKTLTLSENANTAIDRSSQRNNICEQKGSDNESLKPGEPENRTGTILKASELELINTCSNEARRNFSQDGSASDVSLPNSVVNAKEMDDNSLVSQNETGEMGVALSVSKKNEETGGRIYDKLHSCLFCQKMLYKIARHLQHFHKNEERVKSLIALPVNSRARIDGFALLVREGDYHHNCRVIESNRGELILARRPGKLEAKCLDRSDYEACPHCLGFGLKKNLWRHKRMCFSRKQYQSEDAPKNQDLLEVGDCNKQKHRKVEEEESESELSESLHSLDGNRAEVVSNICKKLIVRISPLPRIYEQSSSEDDFDTNEVSNVFDNEETHPGPVETIKPSNSPVKESILKNAAKIGEKVTPVSPLQDVSEKSSSQCDIDFSNALNSFAAKSNDSDATSTDDEAVTEKMCDNLQTSQKQRTKRLKISVSSKNQNTGARIYDKVHSCLFCQKKIIKFSKHLQHVHKDEERVKLLMKLPKNSKERVDGFALLLREGDYLHNCRVIESNEGELILARRPGKLEAKTLSPKDYEPCPKCLGFVRKKNLWCHKKSCCLPIEKKQSSEIELMATKDSLASNVCKNEEKEYENDLHSGLFKHFYDAASFNVENQESLDDASFSLEIAPNIFLDFLDSEPSDSENHFVEANNPNFIQSSKLTTPCFEPEICLVESGSQNKIESEGIKLSVSRKRQESGKRIYDKLYSCLFCEKKVSKIGRHLLSDHKDEEKVKTLAALPLNSKERIDGFALLVREGNYYHNCRVLESNEGELILARRPGKHEVKTLRPTDYESCLDCLGFIQKKYLPRHQKRCVQLIRNSKYFFDMGSSAPQNDADHEDNHLDSVEMEYGSAQLLKSTHESRTENASEIQGALMVQISLPSKDYGQNSPFDDFNSCGTSNNSSIEITYVKTKEADIHESSNSPDKAPIPKNAAKVCVMGTEVSPLQDVSEQISSECDIDFSNALNAFAGKSNDSDATSTDDEAVTEKMCDSLQTSQKQRIKRLKISVSSKNQNTGARIYDKVHSCLFCQKKIIKFSKHLQHVHKDEKRVKLLMKLPKNSKERVDGFALLLREGDYLHNCRVIESNEGELILARRPGKLEAKTLSPKDYEPCPKCLGFVRKKNLWCHKKLCCLPMGKKTVQQN